MRIPPAVVILVLFAAPVAAQPSAYLAEVTADSVAVRSGPGDQMPETGTLFRGTQVVVDHEEGDQWVAIRPPRGQVSWIKHLFVKPIAEAADGVAHNMMVVSEGEVEIAAGRPGSDKPLDVRRTRIPDSAIVLVIGKKVEHDGTHWYPIEPPDGDFRYLPKSAVRIVNAQPAKSFVVRDNPQTLPPETRPTHEPVTASIPAASGGGAVRPANWPNHTLWQQAEQAERQEDYARAELLYLKLAAEMNQTGGDAELANLCYARVHAVREKQRSRSSPGGQPRNDPPTGQWAGPGEVRRTGLPPINGRTVYSLDGARSRYYAIAGQGVDLERFRGQEVQLYGELSHPGELRGVGLLTVTRVQLTRDR